MGRRGSSLVTVLLVTTVMMTLGFAAAGMSTSNLLLSNQAMHQNTARNLAEAVIARAIAHLQADPSFKGGLRVEFASAPSGSEGLLHFEPSAGDAYSTNNLAKDNSVAGWRATVVPGQTAHLVGSGRCRGAKHQVEAIVFLSRYPFAIASSGPVRSRGGLTVASLEEEEARDSLAGSLASNSQDASRAVELEGTGIEVAGDVQAAGSIFLGPQVRVGGALRPHHDAAALPRLRIEDFDTLGKPGLATLNQTSFDTLTVEGFTRIDQRLTITDQGLELRNGVLYVDGDLDVSGGIRGTGAVVSTGSVRVVGGLGVGEGKAALLARGDVTLLGTPQQSQGFSGLLYTEGNLSSKYVDLKGVFVANRNGSGSQVQLDNTKVTQDGPPVVDFPVRPGTPPSLPPVAGDDIVYPLGNEVIGRGFGFSAVYNVTALEPDPANPTDYRLRNPADPLSAVRWLVPVQLQRPGGPTSVGFGELAGYGVDAGSISFSRSYLVGPVRDFLADFSRTYPPGAPPPPPDEGPAGEGEPAAGERWTLDLSRFIQTRDRMRILLWREV